MIILDFGLGILDCVNDECDTQFYKTVKRFAYSQPPTAPIGWLVLVGVNFMLSCGG